MADTWTGTLLDAHCSHRRTEPACYGKRSTSRFLLDVNGKKYRLDYSSNQNVRSALMERKGSMKAEPVTVTVTGRIRTDGKIHAHTVGID
jgi:hypothetical protein